MAIDYTESAPQGGTVTSGNFMNRDNESYPDFEQERRDQARQEHDWATGNRPKHPDYAVSGPKEEDAISSSNLTRDEARDLGYVN